MLELIAAVGGGLFVLASLIVGGRLMWLARTTRGLPEFVLGAALFAMGGLGYPLSTVAIQGRDLPEAVRVGMLVGNMLMTGLGMSGIAWFTRRVFRPTEGWSAAVWIGLSTSFAAMAVWQLLGPGPVAYLDDPTANPWHRQTWIGIAVMSWSGCEAMLFAARQRKRLALGLADPVVADRIRLWGLAILCADTISCTSIAFEQAGVQMIGTAAGSLLVGGLGLVTSALLALAFTPPEAYVARVRRRFLAA